MNPSPGLQFSQAAVVVVDRVQSHQFASSSARLGNSSRMEMKRQTEETMGRQYQRVDWP